MKLLNGSELAGYIKERHARQVRSLEGRGVIPKLAIVQTKDDPVINTYVNLKQKYGADIGIDVEVHKITQSEAPQILNKLSNDKTVHGIIVQLPLEKPDDTDRIVNSVNPAKDVDALGQKSNFEPATPMAILWLLSGYNIDIKDKHILLIGRGKLVGAPLERILKKAGHKVEVIDREIPDLKDRTLKADIIVTATGNPAILYPDMIKHGAVIVDAGTASEDGKTVGDLAPEVYKRDDLIITPEKGGVGPLTVCALFENVIRAAELTVD
ncbi:MAG TPA: bifunctional 5,10-methylenetetrahydrofolate dehydrogenase/5,10-methenyltetrahydrofolate cyclohydrolase [Candidatus Saccharimonadales bacterium]|nr:bifunctional 5,10-methylenetetrahydrofolate dehydrogenase/5,10-methenyltetrahydrofolate cyclohydrolase [Candidatus Saccharimonadales bacterium]